MFRDRVEEMMEHSRMTDVGSGCRGLGFGVQGLGFRAEGLEFSVWGSGSRV